MKPVATALFVVAACLAHPGGAAAAEWIAVPECSSLVFFATQQGARFQGRFVRFDARVAVDGDASRPDRIEATIDLASVDTADDERDEAVRDEDFFDTARYPRSKFVTQTIDRRGKGFRATADLTIRDLSRPVVFDFTWLAPSDGRGRARLQGSSILRRLDFGVGQGDWADTDWVGDQVEVRVDLCLERGADGEPAS